MKMVSARAVNYSDVIMFEIRNQQETLVQNGILNASGFLWTNDAKLNELEHVIETLVTAQSCEIYL